MNGETPNPQHILDIYKLYVEMADRVSQRRQAANSFYLSINTALTALAGYLVTTNKTPEPAWVAYLAVTGLVISYLWSRSIRSYRDINEGKFRVIHEIEQLLPFAAYQREWK